MPYSNPHDPRALQAVHNYQARRRRLLDGSNRMSIRILRLLSKRPHSSMEIFKVLWPGKVATSSLTVLRVTNMTIGRARNSFMGLLIERTSCDGHGNIVWAITDTGRDYLDTYNRDPETIIKGERDNKGWLQTIGRDAMSKEVQARRAGMSNATERDLEAMRSRDSDGERDIDSDRDLDIQRVYNSFLVGKCNHSYRAGRGRRGARLELRNYGMGGW